MSLAGCQINPIDVNFHRKKSLEIFDKNSAVTMIQKRQGVESALPPIRVKFSKYPTLTIADLNTSTIEPSLATILTKLTWKFCS